MRLQILVTILGASLALTAPTLSLSTRTDDPLPANFYLEAIAEGASDGPFIGFSYNSFPHDYGVLANIVGNTSLPPALFTFDDNSHRLSFFFSDTGETYESQTPSDGGDIVLDADGSTFFNDTDGQLGTACDGSGAVYIVDSAYTGADALDPWGLCHDNPSYPENTRLVYAPDSFPDTDGDCTRVALRVETST